MSVAPLHGQAVDVAHVEFGIGIDLDPLRGGSVSWLAV